MFYLLQLRPKLDLTYMSNCIVDQRLSVILPIVCMIKLYDWYKLNCTSSQLNLYRVDRYSTDISPTIKFIC
jgi:hypothetical protein